jgi:hypothetical protein
MPVVRRGSRSAGPSRAWNSSLWDAFPPRPPGPPGPRPPGATLATVSSTMVFHSPQDSQRPPHFGVTAPQDWQT